MTIIANTLINVEQGSFESVSVLTGTLIVLTFTVEWPAKLFLHNVNIKRYKFWLTNRNLRVTPGNPSTTFPSECKQKKDLKRFSLASTE